VDVALHRGVEFAEVTAEVQGAQVTGLAVRLR
jgi:hypothetical protein